MPDRFGSRARLAAAVAVLATVAAPLAAAARVAATAPAAAAPAVIAGSPSAAASASASAAPSAGDVSPAAVGGAQLAGQGTLVDYPPGPVPRLPGVKAASFVIADAGTGQVLAARNPHGLYLPASTLKVLTAVALIPVLNPDATVVATKLATSVSPNIVGLLPGHAYKISGLFTALLTISANDAAVALTQATGSFSKGMALINAEARHLQADDTVAVQPNGLDAPGQHTSAYDLALIARQALQMPAFLKYDEVTTAQFRISAKKSVGLYNQNSLLTTYRGALGGKVGWTSAAGATYVGMARRNGVTLIVTLLHCPALTEIKSAKALLNWGFAVDGTVRPVGELVAPLPAAPAGPAAPTTPGGPAAPGTAQPGAGQPGGLRAQAAPAHRAAASPSVLAAAGFSCVAVVAVGLSFACTRRQRVPREG